MRLLPLFIGYWMITTVRDQRLMLTLIVVAGVCYSLLFLIEIRLSPQITDAVVHDYIRLAAEEEGPADPLTPREREVLQLLAEGDSTKEMAARLNVSVKTVETHRRQVMEKLDLHSVAELTKYAIRTGLTSLD